MELIKTIDKVNEAISECDQFLKAVNGIKDFKKNHLLCFCPVDEYDVTSVTYGGIEPFKLVVSVFSNATFKEKAIDALVSLVEANKKELQACLASIELKVRDIDFKEVAGLFD